MRVLTYTVIYVVGLYFCLEVPLNADETTKDSLQRAITGRQPMQTIGDGTVPSVASGTMVNGTAAKVSKQVISVEDVLLFAVVHRFLEKKTFSIADDEQIFEVNKKQLYDYTQKLIFETMVLLEIEKFKVTSLSNAQMQQQLEAKLKDRHAKQIWTRILKHFGKTEKEGIEVVRNMKRAQRFIQQKVDTLTPLVTQSDIDNYLAQKDEGKKDFAALSRQEQLDIEMMIKREKVEKGIEAWIVNLRKDYGAINHLKY